jgi:hypothetical protein
MIAMLQQRVFRTLRLTQARQRHPLPSKAVPPRIDDCIEAVCSPCHRMRSTRITPVRTGPHPHPSRRADGARVLPVCSLVGGQRPSTGPVHPRRVRWPCCTRRLHLRVGRRSGLGPSASDQRRRRQFRRPAFGYWFIAGALAERLVVESQVQPGPSVRAAAVVCLGPTPPALAIHTATVRHGRALSTGATATGASALNRAQISGS